MPVIVFFLCNSSGVRLDWGVLFSLMSNMFLVLVANLKPLTGIITQKPDRFSSFEISSKSEALYEIGEMQDSVVVEVVEKQMLEVLFLYVQING